MAGNDTTIQNLIYLCGCAVNGIIPEAEKVSITDLDVLYREADRHMLTAVVAYALEMAGIHDVAFEQARAKAIWKMATMDAEQAKVLARLEKAGIWYMPLKGAVLKDLYPAYGIRQMSDRDILFDAERAEDVRSVMEELGFTTKEYGKSNHDCYIKLPVSNFEMHRELFAHIIEIDLYSYYHKIKERLLKDENNKYGWHFRPEDFYIFLVAHSYKHFSDHGTGLRTILDTYIYLKNNAMDMEYVEAECKKLGIPEFEVISRSLAIKLFNGAKLTEDEKRMLEYAVASGTYGNERHKAEKVLLEKGRWGYFQRRLTAPFNVMIGIYPVLKKAPFLYPFCWAHRLIHAFYFENKKVMYQLKTGLIWKNK